MKTLTVYKCEICNAIYSNKEEAKKCESRGKEPILADVGRSVIYRDDWNGGFGTCYMELKVVEVEDRGHYNAYGLGDDYPTEYIINNNDFINKCTIVE